MKKSKLVKIVIPFYFLGVATLARAQEPLPETFFPLQIGNQWGMVSTDPPPMYYTQSYSVGDTSRFEDQLFYRSRYSFFFLGNKDYFRVDSLGNFVVRRQDTTTEYFNFNMQPGDSLVFFDPDFPDTGYTACIQRREVTNFLGKRGIQIDFFMDFSQSLPEAEKYISFQQGVGPVAYTFTIHDLPMKLKWAMIDGKIYGDTTRAVGDPRNLKITHFALEQNYPNPFNASTIISYHLQKPAKVTLRLYNLLGEEIKTLFDGENAVGVHKVIFNADDCPSGIYFYNLKTDAFSISRKLVIQK